MQYKNIGDHFERERGIGNLHKQTKDEFGIVLKVQMVCYSIARCWNIAQL